MSAGVSSETSGASPRSHTGGLGSPGSGTTSAASSRPSTAKRTEAREAASRLATASAHAAAAKRKMAEDRKPKTEAQLLAAEEFRRRREREGRTEEGNNGIFQRRSGMDVMMALEGSALHELRSCFELKQANQGKGLDKQEFVGELLRLLTPEGDDVLPLLSDLIELFEQIDINGDGTMEWAEFTSFCVEAGLLATRRVKVPLRYHYVEDNRYVDTLTRGNVKAIGYVPELEQTAASDGAEPVLRFYDDNMRFVGMLDLRVGVRTMMDLIEGDQIDQFLNPNELKACVDCFAWVPTLEVLAVASSDLSLSFWEQDPNHKGRWRFQGRTVVNAVVRKLVWDEETQLLYSAGGHEVNKHHARANGRAGIVAGWHLHTTSLPGSTREMLNATQHVAFEGVHHDIAVDLVVMRHYKMLCSGSMDRKPKGNLAVWDLVTGKLKFLLEEGHDRGIKQLAWANDQSLLLSCGFEYEALVWDVKTSRRPIMRLVGHRAPLMGIVCVKFNPLIRAVTADIKGNFKMWSVRRSTHSTAMVLQSWEPHDEQVRRIGFRSTFVFASSKASIGRSCFHSH